MLVPRQRVSIPFHRESVSKDHDLVFVNHRWGKVSIPFVRESVSKGNGGGAKPTQNMTKFPFPSYGKAYPKSSYDSVIGLRDLLTFQFPSNGKAYPKIMVFSFQDSLKEFPFPSTGKAYPKTSASPDSFIAAEGFHSLQPGKPIQRMSYFLRFAESFSKVSIPFNRESLSKAKKRTSAPR